MTWARTGKAELERYLHLHHRHLVTYRDFGVVEPKFWKRIGMPRPRSEDEQLHWVVMTRADSTLAAMIEERHRGADRPLDAPAAVRLWSHLRQALAYLKEQGIVHGDIKPSNVLAFSGAKGIEWRLSDFGVSVKLRPGLPSRTRLGHTPAFESPSAHRSGKVSPQDDLYAAALTVHLAVTGRFPEHTPTGLALDPNLPTDLVDDLASALYGADGASGDSGAEAAVAQWAGLLEAAGTSQDPSAKAVNATELGRALRARIPDGTRAPSKRAMQSWILEGTVPFGQAAWNLEHPDPRALALRTGLMSLATSIWDERLASEWINRLVENFRTRTADQGSSAVASPVDPLIVQLRESGRARLRDLDLGDQRWRQRSADTGNEVPNYVDRQEDKELSRLINAAASASKPMDRLVIVVGDPASGKTRSLLHHLTKGLNPDREVLIPRLAVSLVDFAIALQSEKRGRRFAGQVVLLDDLQDRLATDPKTIEGVLALAAIPNTVVAVTVHRRDLPHPDQRLDLELQRRVDEMGLPETKREQLWNRAVELRRTLDLAEVTRATQFIEQLEDGGIFARPIGDYVDLANRLSSQDRLDRLWEATHLGTEQRDVVRRAVLDAMLDRWLMTRDEVDGDHLFEAASQRYVADNPGQPYLDRTEFNQAIGWVRQPSPPHAFSFTRAPSPGMYLLDDRVALTKLASHTSTADTASRNEAFTAAAWHMIAGSNAEARKFLLRAAAMGEQAAYNTLGNIAEEEGEIADAINWYRQGAEAGDTAAMANLGQHALASGDKATARLWWRHAAEAGLVDVCSRLGDLARAEGDLVEARSWYEHGAKAGNASSVTGLGELAYDEGDSEKAFELWQVAARKGDSYAKVCLGAARKDAGEDFEARLWWEDAADDGDTIAMTNLGLLANEGECISEAKRWWEQAASLGSNRAEYYLAVALHNEGDDVNARLHAEAAARAGHVVAAILIGRIAAREGDASSAREWLEPLAADNEAEAMLLLGGLCKDDGDLESARQWWLRAAELGNGWSMHCLSWLAFEEGHPDEARDWLVRSANAGHAQALEHLAEEAFDRDDTETARFWWQRAADEGQPGAMYRLGRLNESNGDIHNACAWYEKAAEIGHADAMVSRGLLAHDAERWDEARNWYEQAAELGHPLAFANLGVLARSQGQPQEAARRFRQAVDAGHNASASSLGRILYEEGDLDEARAVLAPAAGAGDTDAMVTLAMCAATDLDAEEALRWLMTASAEGHPHAAELLREFPPPDVDVSE
jgi:hypothetical protein